MYVQCDVATFSLQNNFSDINLLCKHLHVYYVIFRFIYISNINTILNSLPTIRQNLMQFFSDGFIEELQQLP
jgi:hypothetical protein